MYPYLYKEESFGFNKVVIAEGRKMTANDR